MNLFRSSPDPDLAKALANLDRVSAAYPDLAEAATLLRELLRVAFDGKSTSLFSQPLSPAAFRSSVLELDSKRLDARLRGILNVLRTRGDQASELLDLHRKGRVSAANLVRARFDPTRAIGPDAGEPRDPFETAVLRLLLLPDLARIVREDRENEWFCPWCGDEPLLAESRGLEQLRFLRCGTCGGATRAPRLGCPCCGELRHDRIRIFQVGEDGDRRSLLACSTCGLRLKMLRTLSPLTPPGLLVAELELTHLGLLDLDQWEEK